MRNKQFISLQESAFDTSLYETYGSLRNYLKQTGWDSDPSQVDGIVHTIKDTLYNQLQYFCFLVYHIMEMSSQWGDAGEQQIKISFCRNVLHIPPEESLTQSHAIHFISKVNQQLAELGILSLSLTEAQHKRDNFVFTLFHKSFSIHSLSHLSRLLEFIESGWFLHGGYYGHEVELILGKGSVRTLEDYRVIEGEHELLRTPNTIVAMAAIIGDKEILMRKESLITIFHQKWVPFYMNLEQEKAIIALNPFRHISEGIKARTLSLYQAADETAIQKIQPIFIQDMGETILFHELGHGIIQHTLLKKETGAIGEATKIFGESIVTDLLEYLADFAPPRSSIWGALYNMAIIAEKDCLRAERMFYMYLSDTWFFDTSDTYMYGYSEILSLILSAHIQDDLSIHFEKLKDSSLTEWVIEEVVSIVSTLIQTVKTCSFLIEDTFYTFESAKEKIFHEIQKHEPELETSSYKFITALWTSLFDHVLHSPSCETLKQLLLQEKQRVMKELMIRVIGEETAKRFHYNIRDYIVWRFNELGIPSYIP